MPDPAPPPSNPAESFKDVRMKNQPTVFINYILFEFFFLEKEVFTRIIIFLLFFLIVTHGLDMITFL